MFQEFNNLIKGEIEETFKILKNQYGGVSVPSKPFIGIVNLFNALQ